MGLISEDAEREAFGGMLDAMLGQDSTKVAGRDGKYLLVDRSSGNVKRLQFILINPDTNSPVAALVLQAIQDNEGKGISTDIIPRNLEALGSHISTNGGSFTGGLSNVFLKATLGSNYSLERSLQTSLEALQQDGHISPEMLAAANKFKELAETTEVVSKASRREQLLRPLTIELERGLGAERKA